MGVCGKKEKEGDRIVYPYQSQTVLDSPHFVFLVHPVYLQPYKIVNTQRQRTSATFSTAKIGTIFPVQAPTVPEKIKLNKRVITHAVAMASAFRAAQSPASSSGAHHAFGFECSPPIAAANTPLSVNKSVNMFRLCRPRQSVQFSNLMNFNRNLGYSGLTQV